MLLTIAVYLVLADPEAIADELNPLTISHIARTISFKIIGRYKIINAEVIAINSNRFTSINNMAATTPHTDIHRGMSFD